MEVMTNEHGRARRSRREARARRGVRIALVLLLCLLSRTSIGSAQTPPPELTAPVNDFAHVIDPDSAAQIDKMIRALKAASGDVVVVATVPDIEGYGDIREYINKMFENHGKGIGDKGRDNGLLILLAMKERRVQIEPGYELEQWVTDGFAGETSRLVMTPHFREGNFGAGLLAGTARIISRIAQGRGVTLQDVPVAREPEQQDGTPVPMAVMLLIFFAILMIGRIGRGGGRGLRRWGGGGWSGWSSGVGPFGGGWGGGFGGGGGGFGGGGGGFGGGFGGFGGGRSGGGGGGAGW
jgi:uncharacterized protein